MSPEKIRKVYGEITDFLKPAEEQVHHGSLASATFTDDTQESLIIADVLTEAKGYDEALFLKKMKEWAIQTDILNSTVIGPSTRAFLTAIMNNGDVAAAGRTGDTNGGAMRAAPIGIFYAGDFDNAVKKRHPVHPSVARLAPRNRVCVRGGGSHCRLRRRAARCECHHEYGHPRRLSG